jgi:hypothetical protein
MVHFQASAKELKAKQAATKLEKKKVRVAPLKKGSLAVFLRSEPAADLTAAALARNLPDGSRSPSHQTRMTTSQTILMILTTFQPPPRRLPCP